MRCRNCDQHVSNEDPKYCPHCGSTFEEKTLSDIEFPIEAKVVPRVNLHRIVEEETGVDLGIYSDFVDEYPIEQDILIHSDGSVDQINQGDSRN